MLIIVLTAVILSIAAQSGFCVDGVSAETLNNTSETVNNITQTSATTNVVPNLAQEVNSQKGDAIIKFGIAMVGVILSSVVIFLGLWVYNKFFVDKTLFPNNDPDDILNTPKTVDDAVNFFIKRNKLC